MSETAGSVNTSDLAKELAATDVGKSLEMSQVSALKVIQTFVDTIAGHLAQGETVHIHNFGNIKVLDTKQRQGKNPKTKEPITIEAGKRVHLSVSQHLKEAASSGKIPTRAPRAPRPKTEATAKPAKGAAAAAPAPTKAAKAAAAAPAAPNGGTKGAKAGGFRPATEAKTAAEDI